MLAHDFRLCEEITRANAKPLYTACSRLPLANRNGIWAVYSYCRLLRETACSGAIKTFNKLELEFGRFRQDDHENRFYLRGLANTLETFAITDLSPYAQMLQGQRQNLLKQRFSTLAELLQHCDLVAASAVEMIWPMVSDQRVLKLKPLKQALGRALELTRILQDVGKDFAEDRLYFPLDILQAAGYSLQDMENGLANDAFIQVWEEIAQLAEEYYGMTGYLFRHIYPAAQRPIAAAVAMYQEIIHEVRRADYQVFIRRIVVPRWTSLRVLSQLRI